MNLLNNYEENTFKRFILWNKGYDAQNESLPSLFDLQVNIFKIKLLSIKVDTKINQSRLVEYIITL